MSANNQGSDLDAGLASIQAAAGAAQSRVHDESESNRLDNVEERLAGIEPLLEQVQANSQIAIPLKEYIELLKAEQKFFNRARYGVGCLSLICIIGAFLLLGLAIFHPLSPLLKAPPFAIAAFTVGLSSGIVFLVGSFTKGVFRSTAERHADGFIPPSLQAVADLYEKVGK